MKSIEEYIEKKINLQESITNFLENENNGNAELKNIIEKLNDDQIRQDRHEMAIFLYMISTISKHHHRSEFFFNKIEDLLLEYKDEIQFFFDDKALFQIFQSNKRVLLFLINQKILTINQSIADKMINKYRKFNYKNFFFPELKIFLKNEQNESKEIDESCFEENRKIGENDSYICKLIRDDDIDKFINFVNSKNYQLSSVIESSIFETNPLLNKKNPSLIEYSAFFGSIQIFKYLLLNKVEFDDSLLIFSIHGCNSELIHIVEENVNKVSNYVYVKSVFESIKCHQNDLAIYFLNNYNQNEEIIYFKGIKYYNYCFFPSNLTSLESFYFFCKYNYYKIVDFIIQKNEIDINFIVISKKYKYFNPVFMNIFYKRSFFQIYFSCFFFSCF